MPETDIGNAVASDLTNAVTDYSVDAATTDGAQGNTEIEWMNERWTEQLGYYKAIPELQSAIDAKATWTVGKGFKAPLITEMLLMSIKGFGKDTFNTILENAIRTYHIGGDAFVEIIRDKNGLLVNLKPLDPGSIKIVANKKGVVKRYEQVSRTKEANKTFFTENILHLSRNRVADEIHGESLINAVENIILMRNEAMSDMRQLMHRHVRPIVVFELDTDDTTEIAAFKTTADAATENGENIYIPKGAVEYNIQAVAPNSTLNPLPWIQQLNQYFFQACGVPQIVVGGSQEITEASAKILYLAFQQTIEEEQLYIEEQILSQINLEIKLEFPASLENELLSDKAKDGPVNVQPNETTAGVGQ